MPPRNSATRGARFPSRGSRETALVTRPPSRSRSRTPASSCPKPAVPAARRKGFWNWRPKTLRERSEAADLTAPARGAGSASAAGPHGGAGRGLLSGDAGTRPGAGPPLGCRGAVDVGLERVLQRPVFLRTLAPEKREVGTRRVLLLEHRSHRPRPTRGRARVRRASPWARRATRARSPRPGGTVPAASAGATSVSRAVSAARKSRRSPCGTSGPLESAAACTAAMVRSSSFASCEDRRRSGSRAGRRLSTTDDRSAAVWNPRRAHSE